MRQVGRTGNEQIDRYQDKNGARQSTMSIVYQLLGVLDQHRCRRQLHVLVRRTDKADSQKVQPSLTPERSAYALVFLVNSLHGVRHSASEVGF